MPKVVLPMSAHEYKTYPNIASLLCILHDHPETLPWICNNFIQIVYYPSLQKVDYITKTDCFFDSIMFDCPWLHIQTTHRDLIDRKWGGSIVDYAVDCLDSGFYVNFVADQFYIRASDAYQIREHNHDMFIYGYDSEAGLLFIADSMKDGKYVQTTCSYDEMEQAYHRADLAKDWFDRRVFSYSFKPEPYFQYKKYLDFDSRFAVNLLNRYLHSTVPDLDICRENTYGIGVYDKIQAYLSQVCDTGSRVDIRPVHLLNEHKKFMLLRIGYMNRNGCLTGGGYEEAYEEIKRMHETCLGLLLKYVFTGESQMIVKVKHFLEKAVVEEKRVLSEMIPHITRPGS